MKNQWGGKRPGSGPPRKRLNLDKDAARDLAALTKQWRSERNNQTLTEEEVVNADYWKVWPFPTESLARSTNKRKPVLPHPEVYVRLEKGMLDIHY